MDSAVAVPRPQRRRSLLAGLGLLLIVLSLPAVSTPRLAEAAVGACPPGYLPGPSNSNEIWTDDNVAVYAGADFLADGAAAESEGLMVVMGSATFDKDAGGHFNVGTVGVGSEVTPTPGTVMLAVGGDLTVGTDTVLDVGAGSYNDAGVLAGGAAKVGGAASPTFPASQYVLNNGSLTTGMGADAVATWSTFGTDLTANSATWAALVDTGTAIASGNRVDIAGDGTSTQQVFTIDAADLDGVSEYYFTGIPGGVGVSVIVNVVGSGPVTLGSNYFADDGVRADDMTSTLFGQVAQRTMWNFAQATSVSFDGAGQFLGSVAAPAGDIDVVSSMNGRVYAGGSIHMHGGGAEIHNYPWNATPYSCIPIPALASGSVEITKVLDANAPVEADRRFYGWLECSDPALRGSYYHEGSIQAGTTVTVTGLPIGARCSVYEDPDFTGDQPPLPDGYLWAEPVWTVNGEVLGNPSFTIVASDDPVQVELSVANTALGRMAVTKVVDGPAGAYSGDRTFAIDYTCDADAYDADGVPLGTGSDTGTVEVEAGSTVTSPWFPLGTTCTISESATTPESRDFVLPDGFVWGTPSVVPASVVIDSTTSAPVAVTVTNPFEAIPGAFTITKVLDPSTADSTADFTVGYACTPLGPTGSVTLAAGETSATIEAPVGSTCSVSEDDLPAPPDGWTWDSPTITGSPLTVTAGSMGGPIAVTVTNALVDTTTTTPPVEPPTTTDPVEPPTTTDPVEPPTTTDPGDPTTDPTSPPPTTVVTDPPGSAGSTSDSLAWTGTGPVGPLLALGVGLVFIGAVARLTSRPPAGQHRR